MEINGKRICLVVVISIVLVLLFVFLNFTVSQTIVKGEENVSFVKETDTEFDLENDASLRNKPEFSSKVSGTIKKGTHVQVLRKLNKWVKITDGTNEGWVVMQNVVTVEVENVEDSNNTVTSNIENETTNQTGNTAVDQNNTSNKVENNTAENKTNTTTSNSVQNEVGNNISNTSNTTSSSTATSNVGKTGLVNVDTAKVREEPDGKLVGLVDLNDKVEILSEEGDWYKVNVDEYKGCYIAKRLVTVK